MFVVFEGIDGSGKTTVSNRVAKKLRKRGHAVEHIREGGEFASPLVSRMRLFGKDTRNLSMAPLTELLFYAARDAQLLAENILPALERGGIVFADRYVYSYEVLSHFGRGLDQDRVRGILEGVAGGVWPELVVLMDVDPHIARARRKVSKIDKRATGARAGGGSRKGLGGVGTQHRLRDGYRAIAEREPNWLVIDNADPEHGLDAVVAQVVEAIEALANGKPAAEIAGNHVRARSGEAPASLDAGKARFYEAIATRAAVEPSVGAYLIAGLDDAESYQWRDRLADAAPNIVAFGLRGNGDDDAWALRERLAPVAPHWVARSIDGLQVEGPRAEDMRRRLVAEQPVAVLATLDGVDSPAAWELRRSLADSHLRDVVSSLKRIDSDEAWALRDRYREASGAEGGLDAPEVAGALASSVRGLANERAWEVRRSCMAAAPVPVIRSLIGVEDDDAWQLRSELVERAAKVVMASMSGSVDARAWELRRVHAPRVKEAVDSMIGLDGDAAWAIREAVADVWPSTVVKSLGELALQPRGEALALRLLAAHPDNISLLKHITRIVARRAAADDLQEAG